MITRKKKGYILLVLGVINAIFVSPVLGVVTSNGMVVLCSTLVSVMLIGFSLFIYKKQIDELTIRRLDSTRMHILKNRLNDNYKESRETAHLSPTTKNVVRRETLKNILNIIEEIDR